MATRLSTFAPHAIRASVARPTTAALFGYVVFAIVLQFVFSQNILSQLGYKLNVHPATFLIMVCALYAMARGLIPVTQRLRDAPGLMLFVFGIPVVALYSICFAGFSGSTVFVESFWSAGVLALLLEPASAKQKRILGRILIGLVVGNIFVAMYESIAHVELFPISLDPSVTDLGNNDVDDFRAHAFYAHPLTASLVTSMAIFFLYSTRMRLIYSAPIFGFMLVGLLAFGGRTALGVTALLSIAAAFFVLVAGLARRRLSLDFVLVILVAFVFIPPIIAIIVGETTMADRIIHNLYYDDSAAVRATQWRIFDYLSLNDWLFGMPKQRVEYLKYQIGLGAKNTDIENFWILLFLNLGAFGFTLFVVIFGSFLVHLGRYTNTLNSWLLVGAALMINSTSNSLAVWTNDLLIEVAFLIAISGFRAPLPVHNSRASRITVPTFKRLNDGGNSLMATPVASNWRSLRRL